ncbi:MAG TPA: MauE/DoxX family redox-associated membrane protein [Actinomycetota bacterium]|nr:MauE/DoxX family redox-associated membrane protein [Actinomycetota bacterium]
MELFVWTGVLSAHGLLAFAGVEHLRDREALSVALRAQRAVPRSLVHPLTNLLAGAELLLGVGGVVGVIGFGSSAEAVRLLLAGAGVLFGAFALYSSFLLLKRPGAPCACGGGDHAANTWTVARAAVLMIAPLAAAAAVVPLRPWVSVGIEEVVTVLAAIAFGWIVWQFPAAVPDPYTRARGVGVNVEL